MGPSDGEAGHPDGAERSANRFVVVVVAVLVLASLIAKAMDLHASAGRTLVMVLGLITFVALVALGGYAVDRWRKGQVGD